MYIRRKRLVVSQTEQIVDITVRNKQYRNFRKFNSMSRHQLDLIQCMKQPGSTIGKLCEKCDGRCPCCDSYITNESKAMARVCDDCSFGNFSGKCILCGNKGVSDAYYCLECVQTEKDRDGCPKIINIGSNRSDLFYGKKKGTRD